MKFLRYFLMLSVLFCSNLFSMGSQKANIAEILPKDAWSEIFNYIKNLDFKTEDELIKTFNSLRATNKRLYNLVNEYIKSQVKPNEKYQYSYKNLLLVLIDQVIQKKAKDSSLDARQVGLDFEAYHWFKAMQLLFSKKDPKKLSELNSWINDTFIEKLKDIINSKSNSVIEDKYYQEVEKLLKIGANYNIDIDYYNPKFSFSKAPALWIFVNQNNPRMVKLLLNYGAYANSYVSNMNMHGHIGSKNISSIDLAKQKLREAQGFIGYYTGMAKETEEIKKIKEIIKMLEDAIKKQSEKKEFSGKEEKQEA